MDLKCGSIQLLYKFLLSAVIMQLAGSGSAFLKPDLDQHFEARSGSQFLSRMDLYRGAKLHVVPLQTIALDIILSILPYCNSVSYQY
jgi:hypothetical protein